MPQRRRVPLIVAILVACPFARAADHYSNWVRPGPDGRLVYKTTDRGDRILDFSYAGYEGGGVALPDVPARRTIEPTGTDDDSAAIQSAIDAVSKLPPDHGFRGAVELTAGTYKCPSTLTITADGVVLRGVDHATLALTGKPHVGITVGNRAARHDRDAALPEGATARATISDPYVPSGANSFTVASSTGLSVGDWVAIRRPVTEKWVHFMHMDDLVRDGKPQTWLKPGSVTTALRRIASIDGNKITTDVPLSDSYDATYLNPPGTAVVKVPPPSELSHAGIERLRITCPPQAINHTEAHFSALHINGQDCFARDLVIEETMNSVGVTGRRVTLRNVSVTRKAQHQGSSKPAEFAPDGTQVLLDRCSVDADNVWFVATGAGVSGPIVLLNCHFRGTGDAESHQRWSTGILYDNCHVEHGGITLRNRGSMGSGHGWTMGWGVVWNCAADHYIIQNPPGALNWLIGSTGANRPAQRPFDAPGTSPNLPPGVEDSANQPVEPRSLYLAQLRDRLGDQALKNIGYERNQ